MDLKKLLFKEKPTLEYMKKQDKFAWNIYVISIASLIISGSLYGAYTEEFPVIFAIAMVLSFAMYIIYFNSSYNIVKELKTSN